MTTNTEILTFMRETPLLAGFDDTFTAELARRCPSPQAAEGRDPLPCNRTGRTQPYLVRSGSIFLFLTNLDGRELVVNEMRPGTYSESWQC